MASFVHRDYMRVTRIGGCSRASAKRDGLILLGPRPYAFGVPPSGGISCRPFRRSRLKAILRTWDVVPNHGRVASQADFPVDKMDKRNSWPEKGLLQPRPSVGCAPASLRGCTRASCIMPCRFATLAKSGVNEDWTCLL